MDFDQSNRAVFDHPDVVSQYARSLSAPGWLNAGEWSSVLAVADQVRGLPILDVGVGSGRTTTLLRQLSSEYTAIDYSEKMLEQFSKSFPLLESLVADARDLSALGERSYGLSMFSNNGIDAVPRQDRALILEQLRSVSGSGAMAIFSTLHLGGPSFGERPLQIHRPSMALDVKTLVAEAARGAAHPAQMIQNSVNWSRQHRRMENHGSWGLDLLRSHGFTLLVHFTTVTDIHELVGSVDGWELESVRGEDGILVHSESDCAGVDSFTVTLRAV